MDDSLREALAGTSHGYMPVVASQSTKRIRPRPIAISLSEAIAYRDKPIATLVRIARNVNAVLHDVPVGPLRGMDCTKQREVITCPFAKVGDVLYTREAWSTHAECGQRDGDPIAWDGHRYSYRADWPLKRSRLWHASASMPFDAARNVRKVVAIECLEDYLMTEELWSAARLSAPALSGMNRWNQVYSNRWHWIFTLGEVDA